MKSRTLTFTNFAHLVADYIDAEYDEIMGPSPYLSQTEREIINGMLKYHYELDNCNVGDAAGNIVNYLRMSGGDNND